MPKQKLKRFVVVYRQDVDLYTYEEACSKAIQDSTDDDAELYIAEVSDEVIPESKPSAIIKPFRGIV